MSRPGLLVAIVWSALCWGTIAAPGQSLSLHQILQLMDQNIPTGADGYSTDVTVDVCKGDEIDQILTEPSPWFVNVYEQKIFGKRELVISRTVWFFATQSLVIARLETPDCSAWIYVRPFMS